MGMKTNNMSEIENSRLVTVRLLDPLKMLQQLVLEASQDLVKAHHSCADQMDRSPAQELTDGALKKCKEIRDPLPANANATDTTTSTFMKATQIDASHQDTKSFNVDKPSNNLQPQSMFAARVTLFTGNGDKDGGGACTCLKVLSLLSLYAINHTKKKMCKTHTIVYGAV